LQLKPDPLGGGAMPFPVAERWIVEAEPKLGVRFPDGFRLRMQANNGGEVVAADDAWQLYPIYDQPDRKRIRRTCNDIVRETGSAREWAGFPQHAIAIGSNGSGDQLVYVRNPNSKELLVAELFVWNHETRQLEPTGSPIENFA